MEDIRVNIEKSPHTETILLSAVFSLILWGFHYGRDVLSRVEWHPHLLESCLHIHIPSFDGLCEAFYAPWKRGLLCIEGSIIVITPRALVSESIFKQQLQGPFKTHFSFEHTCNLTWEFPNHQCTICGIQFWYHLHRSLLTLKNSSKRCKIWVCSS